MCFFHYLANVFSSSFNSKYFLTFISLCLLFSICIINSLLSIFLSLFVVDFICLSVCLSVTHVQCLTDRHIEERWRKGILRQLVSLHFVSTTIRLRYSIFSFLLLTIQPRCPILCQMTWAWGGGSDKVWMAKVKIASGLILCILHIEIGEKKHLHIVFLNLSQIYFTKLVLDMSSSSIQWHLVQTFQSKRRFLLHTVQEK